MLSSYEKFPTFLLHLQICQYVIPAFQDWRLKRCIPNNTGHCAIIKHCIICDQSVQCRSSHVCVNGIQHHYRADGGHWLELVQLNLQKCQYSNGLSLPICCADSLPKKPWNCPRGEFYLVENPWSIRSLGCCVIRPKSPELPKPDQIGKHWGHILSSHSTNGVNAL